MRARGPLVLTLMAGAFAFGLVRLLQLRFDAGDVYPSFSSLSAGPAGTRAFYEGLAKAGGASVRRNFRPLETLAPSSEGETAALFLFGVDSWQLVRAPEERVRRLETLARSGSRVVVALAPETHDLGFRRIAPVTPRQEKGDAKPRKRPSPTPTPDPESAMGFRTVSLPDRWGFETAFASPPESLRVVRRGKEGAPALPASLAWRSGLWFRRLDPAYRVLYERGRNAVLAERHFGKGTIVLSTDSSFVSNAALRRERNSTLLVWLIGPHAQVVFDETHLGLSETPGIASLAARYRLHGFLAGLLLLAALYVWKSSTPFGGPAAEESPDDPGAAVAGRRASEGLAAVLSRGVPRSELLAACFAQWRKSFPRADSAGLEEALRPGGASPGRPPDIVAAYRRASEVLARKKRETNVSR